jgi:hypothetical protein
MGRMLHGCRRKACHKRASFRHPCVHTRLREASFEHITLNKGSNITSRWHQAATQDRTWAPWLRPLLLRILVMKAILSKLVQLLQKLRYLLSPPVQASRKIPAQQPSAPAGPGANATGRANKCLGSDPSLTQAHSFPAQLQRRSAATTC